MKRQVSLITKDLIHIEEKRKVIADLKREQLECLGKIVILASKGSSIYPKVTMNRTFRMLGWGLKARQIQAQINAVKAQPIKRGRPLLLVGSKIFDEQKCEPMFPQGGLPIIGGGEIILTNK